MRSLFCIFLYMDRIAFMKNILLLLGTCIALANARQYTIESLKNPSLSQQTLAQLNQVQKSIDLSRDTLSEEQWLEVEKNEIVKICIDGQIPVWETSLNAAIYNDSCIVFQAPTLIGVDSLKAFFRKDGRSHKINLAIGMKYLNFKNEKVLLGYNETSDDLKRIFDLKEKDPERFALVTGTYLVDKYPVTNCEFIQVLWDSIPEKSTYFNDEIREIQEGWISRKKSRAHNETCDVHDTVVRKAFIYQSMKYANARSIRDGLKPYYIFSSTEYEGIGILSGTEYLVGYWDFTKHEKKSILVTIDKRSDGYRLPYYDEWMMLARGGDKVNDAPWGNGNASFEEISKYSRFNSKRPLDRDILNKPEPVGQLLPTGYGLYDVLGLVEEFVLFSLSHYTNYGGLPFCMKGGGITYGYIDMGYYAAMSGFRLIRNIGNNAKWKEIETDPKQ